MSEEIKGTLQEIAVHLAKKQPHQVENLTEEAPILREIKFEPASHGMWNAYEEVSGIQGVGFVDFDSPLQEVDVQSKLKKIDLGILGGEMFVGEDKAQQFGGAAAYFASKTPTILKEAGMSAEKNLIYKNVIPYAIDNGLAQDAGGSSNCFSMVVVRPVAGEVCGLYNPKGFTSGTLLDVKPINNGALYKNSKGILGYGLRLKSYFGYQLANTKAVGAIVNITKSNLPTATQINDMLLNARADGKTKIWCHPRLLQMISEKYKAEIMKTRVGDQNMNRMITDWNGVPFITSFNFEDGTESQYTISEGEQVCIIIN